MKHLPENFLLNAALALGAALMLIMLVLAVVTGLRERQAYADSLVSAPVLAVAVQDDFEADDEDEAEHYLVLEGGRTVPIADSVALGTDDDRVAREARNLIEAGVRVCAVFERDSVLGESVTLVEPCP